ncbi:MAG: alpha/beta hydrolase [Cyclobacteriaceae bacterium]|nr:alpha/beta hydrolase [Cyclobacteriaceae bacterium]
MSAQINSFHYKQCVLHYAKAGNGPKNLLLFHGFGQNHQVFLPLAESLGNSFTIYVFDLFFHGQSVWPHGDKPIEKDFYTALMKAFLKEHQINRFSIGGFSLGARFALVLTEAMSDRIDHLYLLAPDGIKSNPWYTLATYPLLLRKFFKSMIHKPDRFFSLAKTMTGLHLMDKKLVRFAESQMSTEEKRNRVYHAWVVFRHLNVDLKTLTSRINVHEISVTTVLGGHDNMIKIDHLQKFISQLAYPRLIMIKATHPALINQLTPEVFVG